MLILLETTIFIKHKKLAILTTVNPAHTLGKVLNFGFSDSECRSSMAAYYSQIITSCVSDRPEPRLPKPKKK